MLASVVHLLWFLRYLLKSLPIVLGFNSALHPLAALLSSPGGLWLGREYVNSLIVTITLAILIQGIASYSACSIYALLLLPFPVSLLFSECLSSPQPDVAAASTAPFNVQWQNVLGDWSWIGPWAQQLPNYPIVIKTAGMAAIGLLASLWLLRFGYSRTQLSRWILIFSPVVLSLLFWFFSAPSPRFAQATLWIFAVDLFYLGAIAAAKLTEAGDKLAILVSATFLVLEIIPGLARLN